MVLSQLPACETPRVQRLVPRSNIHYCTSTASVSGVWKGITLDNGASGEWSAEQSAWRRLGAVDQRQASPRPEYSELETSVYQTLPFDGQRFSQRLI